DGVTLEFGFVNRQAGLVLRIFLLVLGLAAGWFLRKQPLSAKLRIGLVLLGGTLAAVAVAPLGWQALLDGVWLGSWAMLAVWSLHAAVRCCIQCCRCCGWNRTTTTMASLLALMIGLSTADTVQAQAKGPAKPPAAAAAKKPAAAAAKKDVAVPPVVAPYIVVPYDANDAPTVSDRVFLPQEKFRELWELAHPDQRPDALPPQDGGLVDALYAARLVTADRAEKDAVLQITARYSVRNLTRGPLTVPLPLGRVAVQSAVIDGKAAAVMVRDGQMHVVVTEPGWHVVDVELAVPALLSGQTGSAQVPLLPVPAGKFSLELPAKGLVLRVNGSSTAYRLRADGDRQVAEFGVDRTKDLALSWQPEQTRAGAAAVIQVESATAVSLTDSGIVLSTGLQYRVRQGGISDVQFVLPATVRLRSVLGPDVGGWDASEVDGQRRLRVFFRRTVSDATQLTLELFQEQVIGGDSQTFDVTVVTPLEITGEVGFVGVFAGDQFTVRGASGVNLSQVNPDRFTAPAPVSRPEAPPALAYRFTKR
ncbi:MAG TPA: hypothetical protein VL132_11925, partial [Planctomycetaceae bacterium]|nr:hypothetical protein [Planctomycetaceae bacterium]